MTDPNVGQPPYAQPYGQPAASQQPAQPPYPQPAQPPYPQPPYPPQANPAQPPGYYAPVAPVYAAPYAPPTNGLAITSLISGIVAWVLLPGIGSLVGVITGHLALSQIKRTGDSGRGLAIAGVILSWVQLGALILLGAVLLLVSLIAIGAAAGSGGLNS